MGTFGRTCVLGVALVCAATAADGGSRIRELLEASPAARGAFWGIQVIDLEKGKTVFELNSRRFFVPASNTKLFTMALALARLGPEHRFQTTVIADRARDAAGVVGSLTLVGGGDPNLSGRAVPYQMGPPPGNPLQAIEELADQVVARGIRRVEGGISGDDTAYVWEPYPEGWAVDDPIWEYGAPVSALTINDNSFSLTIAPGEHAGELARITLTPPLEYFVIDNRVRTTPGAERKISIAREPGSRQLRLWGTIPPKDRGITELLAVNDPALYAACALSDALARRGIVIGADPAARHRFPDEEQAPETPGGSEVARHVSAPLVEDLRITAKVSQNLHAELLLRAVARARQGIGSRKAGLEEMQSFLDEIGIDREGYNLRDGSGLTRLNLVTPASVVQLLGYMYALPARETWLSLMPIAGQDGTLSSRFGDSLAAGRVRAKTGTLSHVSSLSGYAEPRKGGRLAFSILVNNYHGSASDVRAVIDRIVTILVE